MKTSVKVKFNPSIKGFGKGRVYFQIIRNRVVRQYNPGIRLLNNQWLNSDTEPYTTDDNINNEINLFVCRVTKCVESLEINNPKYSVDDIISALSNDKYNLVSYIMKISDRLQLAGKVRTSECYFHLGKRIIEFIGNDNVLISDIDCDFVESFEAYLLSRKMKRNTSSFYLRALRSVWNKAIDAGVLNPTIANPFKHVYTGVDTTAKRNISIQDIKNINNLNLKAHPKLDFARDMFMFSFYTRGMSFIDIACLKKNDIQNGMIIYRRRKTGKILRINVEKNIKRIIDKYSKADSVYVFPIATSMNDEYKRSNNALWRINKSLKTIAHYANIGNDNLTMYVARHSWATIAQNNADIPISVISKGLGHSNEKVTQVYLDSFGNKSIDDANKSIMKLVQK